MNYNLDMDEKSLITSDNVNKEFLKDLYNIWTELEKIELMRLGLAHQISPKI